MTGQSSQPATDRLPVRIKGAYGLGEIGEGIKTSALETFLFFFFAQVVGLPGVLTGLALLLALLVDAVVDPLVGAWSDRTRTRFGSRHPFLYAAPVPLAIALLLLFSPPSGVSHAVLFVWLLAFAAACRVAMTLYFVPHMALGAELSDDFHERVSIGGYRVFFGYVGRLVALGIAFGLFFKASEQFPNGQLNPDAYRPFALVCGALVILVVIVSALGTQKFALFRAAAHPPAGDAVSWLTALRASWRSRSFRAFFFALLMLFVFMGVQSSLALHMNTYFWRLAPQNIQVVFYAQMLGFLVGIPAARPLATRLDKKHAYMLSVTFAGVILTAPPALRLLHLFPENGTSGLLMALAGCNFLYGVVASVGVVLSAAMLADLADEYQEREGDRAQGLFFGVNAFARKATMGLGGALAGVLVDVIGFPVKATPGQVPEDVLYRLGLVCGPGILIILLTGVALMSRYDMGRARHSEILAALAQRRGG